MCSSNAVYPPSFPLSTSEDTQLSSAELQRIQKAVTGPARFLRLLERGCSSKENPKVLTPIQTLSADASEGDTITSFFLIPGGRYMATEGEAICIWDLNQHPIVSRPIVVQPRDWIHRSSRFFFACPTSDYNAFRVVTSGRSLGEDEVTVR